MTSQLPSQLPCFPTLHRLGAHSAQPGPNPWSALTFAREVCSQGGDVGVVPGCMWVGAGLGVVLDSDDVWGQLDQEAQQGPGPGVETGDQTVQGHVAKWMAVPS